jgi:VanZ family protein
MKSFLLYHLPVMLYGGVILAVSSIPHLQTPEVRFLAFDKVAHFLEYALFALLAFRSVSHLGGREGNNRSFGISFVVIALFAVIDEYVQSLTPGRHPDYLDYVFDVLGGTLVLVLLWYRRRRELKRRLESPPPPVQ